MPRLPSATAGKPQNLRASSARRRSPRTKGDARPVRVTAKQLTRHQPLPDAAHLITERATSRLLSSWQETLEAPTPDNVHALRVALRRMRVALAMFRSFDADDAIADMRMSLKDIATLTSRQRDIDVIIADLVQPLISADLPGDVAALKAALERTRDQQNDTTLLDLDNTAAKLLRAKLVHLPRQIQTLVSNAHPKQDGTPPEAGKFAHKILRKRWRSLAADAHNLEDLAPSELHEVRKSLKKLRYTFTHVATFWPKDEQRAFLTQMRRLQGSLGMCNDVASAIKLAEAWRAEAIYPEHHVTLGCVLGIHIQRAARTRRTLVKQWNKLASTDIIRAL